MSERFPANIELGGEVTHQVLEELIKAAVEDDVCAEYGDASLGEDEVRQAFLSGSPRFCDSEASYGLFSKLEAACVKHQVSFIRSSSSYHEFDASIEWLPAGTSITRSVACDSNENVLVPLDDILNILHNVEDKLGFLKEYCEFRMIPALPPLTVKPE